LQPTPTHPQRPIPPLQPPRHSLRRPSSTPSSTDVEALIQILQKKYGEPRPGRRCRDEQAAVQGVVAALGPGAELVTGAPAVIASTNPPPLVRSESIASLIGYARVNKIDAAALKQLDEALTKLDKDKIEGLVLDLRFTKGGTFADATELVSKFLLKDKKLFTVHSVQASSDTTYSSTQPSAFIDWKIAVVITARPKARRRRSRLPCTNSARDHRRHEERGKAVVCRRRRCPAAPRCRHRHGRCHGERRELFPKGVMPDVPIE